MIVGELKALLHVQSSGGESKQERKDLPGWIAQEDGYDRGSTFQGKLVKRMIVRCYEQGACRACNPVF